MKSCLDFALNRCQFINIKLRNRTRFKPVLLKNNRKTLKTVMCLFIKTHLNDRI